MNRVIYNPAKVVTHPSPLRVRWDQHKEESSEGGKESEWELPMCGKCWEQRDKEKCGGEEVDLINFRKNAQSRTLSHVAF